MRLWHWFLFAMLVGLNANAKSATKEIYLAFPSQGCAASICGDRPVLVTEDELKDGVIGFVGGNGRQQGIPVEMMRFIPESSGDPLKDLSTTLSLMGFTDGSWKSKKTGEASYEVTLELTDGKHARREVHKYRVSNGRIESSSAFTVSAFDLIFGTVLIAVLALLGLLIWRFARQRKKAEVISR